MIFSLEKQDPVLVLCPHPDDEIGCGALISKLTEAGHPVYYCHFSDCTQSTRALGFEPIVLLEEMHKSCNELGIRHDRIRGYDIPVRHFPQYRQDILELMVKMRQEIKPRLVLTPCSFDLHQDHVTVAEEAIRAFKHATVLGYEFIWNSLRAELSMFVRVEQRHLDAKLRSWDSYKTQASRAYHGPQIFEALARVRGMMANSEFAEAFEVRRVIV